MATVSFEKFSKGAPVKVIAPANKPVDESQPQGMSFKEKASSISTGIAKGALGGTIGTAQLLQNLGQRAIAGVSPRTLAEIKKDYGFDSLQGDHAAGIDKILASNNGYETTGKALEFLAEVFWPGSKAEEAQPIVNKGKDLFKKIIGGGDIPPGGTASTAEKVLTSVADTGEQVLKGAATTAKTIGADIQNFGKRVLSHKADEIAPTIRERAVDLFTKLDDRTKSALQRTPIEKFQNVLQQGRDALSTDGILTPLENVGESVISGLKNVAKKVRELSFEKGRLLYKTDLWTKPTANLVRDVIDDIGLKFSNIKLDAADTNFLNKFVKELKSLGDNANLGDVDKTIDLLQDKLYKASKSNNTIPTTNRLLGPLRESLGKLNNGAKSIGGELYAKSIDEVARLIRLQNNLNTRLGKEGASAGSWVKRIFSPADGATKKLLIELSKETGVDYFRDARLSKFVMDSLGDPRSKSLLEGTNIPKSVTSATMKAAEKTFDYFIKKTGIADPIKAAEMYIQKYGPKAAKKILNDASEEIAPIKTALEVAEKTVTKKPVKSVKVKAPGSSTYENAAARKARQAKDLADFQSGTPPF